MLIFYINMTVREALYFLAIFETFWVFPRSDELSAFDVLRLRDKELHPLIIEMSHYRVATGL